MPRNFLIRLTLKLGRSIADLRLSPSTTFSPFSERDVVKAITKAKASTALGPDGLTTVHLKNLGPRGVRFLTSLFNLSIAHADIPALWKTANIIPLPKPGKPPSNSLSYRPISLLCPPVKILERLILPFLDVLPYSSSQHGFKTMHSCTTALFPLVQAINRGFNHAKPPFRTTLLAVDLSKAFDCIDHTLLLDKLSSTAVNVNVKRWLKCYLLGRSAFCTYQASRSPSRLCRSGVPQGSCLSPTLFAFFCADMPDTVAEKTMYADDLSFFNSHTSPAVNDARLCVAANATLAWCDANNMSIAPAKSSASLFTPDRHEHRYEPSIVIGGVPVTAAKTPMVLGTTFDSHATFAPNALTLVAKTDFCQHA